MATRYAALALCLSCTSPQRPTTFSGGRDGACLVDVSPADSEHFVLDVSLLCPKLPLTGLSAEVPTQSYIFELTDLEGNMLDWRHNQVTLERPSTGVRYRVDLGAMAKAKADYNFALQVGSSLIAPGYSWLLEPSPVPHDAVVSLRADQRLLEWGFASGLRRERGGYSLRSNEIPVSTFSVFGGFSRTELTIRSGARQQAIELVTLDGELSANSSLLSRWVEDSALAVSQFFGGPPAERTMVAVVPVPNRRGVVHGKVLPESSPGISILLGEYAAERELYADWILVHELFHLGFPSFIREGRWLDEGLATYFEPIIRARSGWVSPQALWREFYFNMHRGLPLLTEDGLEKPRNFDSVYWGGALVSLLADIEARRTSGLRLGLEDGLRQVLLRGGNSSRVWTLERAISIIDEALERPILRSLTDRYLSPKKYRRSVDLGQLFADLGVVRDGDGVRFVEVAPLSKVRKAITHGRPRGKR